MPRILPTIAEPRTRDEILSELGELHRASREYWASFPTAGFVAPIGSSWSPADTVRHLTKSIRPVAKALRLPRLALALLFGPARRPSRSFAEIRDAYRARLTQGVDAGRFAPRPMTEPADVEAYRARITDFHEQAAAALAAGLTRWPEKSLDRYRLPHPVLGKLTVREMLFFTLYHNLHHVLVVERRLAGARAETGDS
jgi:hypothetical protein